MKKQFLKRGLALGLTLAICLGLCACGEKGKNMENAEMAKEHVYKLQPIEMPKLTDSDNGYTNIMQTIHRDGKLYVLMQASSWDPVTYEENIRYCIVSMNEDGTDIQVTDIQIPDEEPVSGDNEAGDDVTGEDSSVEEADENQAEEGNEDVMVMPLDNSYSWENTSYNNFVLNAQGELYGIKLHQQEKNEIGRAHV